MRRVLCVIALAAAAAGAQEPTLKVGTDAPPLAIAKWVKGDPVTIEKGRIYVVEFWTTADEGAMPRLSELQDTYKDKVTFIGVATQDDRGNTLDAVEAMVKDKGPAMGYTVAWDDGEKTRAAWLAAAGVRGIPCAFIVDGNGKIAFFNHPLLLDLPLSRLVAGKWDPVKGPEEMQAGIKLAQEILQMDRRMALSALETFEKEFPELAWTEVVRSRTASSLPAAKLRMLLLAGRNDDATALGTKLLEKGVKFNNPMALNEVAWLIVDPEMKIAKRDLDLAMNAATKAVELTKGEDGAILDTLARVYCWKGDLAKAIEIQTTAVEKAAGNAEMADELQTILDQYKAEAAAKKE
jgi:hypothetical protein